MGRTGGMQNRDPFYLSNLKAELEEAEANLEIARREYKAAVEDTYTPQVNRDGGPIDHERTMRMHTFEITCIIGEWIVEELREKLEQAEKEETQ